MGINMKKRSFGDLRRRDPGPGLSAPNGKFTSGFLGNRSDKTLILHKMQFFQK
jgi:hypothetical protein